MPLLSNAKAPLSGRIIFLLAAYSPVAAIVGIRLWGGCAGTALIVVGLLGSAAWVLFLAFLPRRQDRPVGKNIEQVEYLDSEVTGYLVSILLPAIAVNNPTAADWAAYAACAVLILTVAFASNLWVANPITYLMGYQAARCLVDDKPCVVLYKTRGSKGEKLRVIRAAGVILLLGDISVSTGGTNR